jgi:hypothetical protein
MPESRRVSRTLEGFLVAKALGNMWVPDLIGPRRQQGRRADTFASHPSLSLIQN